VGGIPDLVEHGVNGFLVSPGDVLELSNTIKKIVKDKKLAHEMAEKGRKRITEQFSAEAMVQSIEKVYNECLNAKGITRGN
jgi:glycosyltransferase involved in cell wall biosynthesis